MRPTEPPQQDKKHSFLKLIGLIVVVLLFPFLKEQFPMLWVDHETTQQSQKTQTVELTEVVDGDTIKFTYNGKEEKARLLLIDTPESYETKTGKPQKFGREASDFLEDYLKGKKIDIEFEETHDQKDKYGRLLIYVFADNQLVQEKLVSEGYARVGYENKQETYYSQLDRAQEEAKRSERNIWSIPGYVTKTGFKDE